jgi:hypothetical protein
MAYHFLVFLEPFIHILFLFLAGAGSEAVGRLRAEKSEEGRQDHASQLCRVPLRGAWKMIKPFSKCILQDIENSHLPGLR